MVLLCSIRRNENGLGKDKETWYYMDATGIMKTGEIEVAGHHYYLEDSGAMKQGWLKKGKCLVFLQGRWFTSCWLD